MVTLADCLDFRVAHVPCGTNAEDRLQVLRFQGLQLVSSYGGVAKFCTDRSDGRHYCEVPLPHDNVRGWMISSPPYQLSDLIALAKCESLLPQQLQALPSPLVAA